MILKKPNLMVCCIDFCNLNVFTFPKWRCCLGLTVAGVSSVILLSESVRERPGGLVVMMHTMYLQRLPFHFSLSPIVSCQYPHCHYVIKAKKLNLKKKKKPAW